MGGNVVNRFFSSMIFCYIYFSPDIFVPVIRRYCPVSCFRAGQCLFRRESFRVLYGDDESVRGADGFDIFMLFQNLKPPSDGFFADGKYIGHLSCFYGLMTKDDPPLYTVFYVFLCR